MRCDDLIWLVLLFTWASGRRAMPIIRPMTCFSEWTLKSLQIGFMRVFKSAGRWGASSWVLNSQGSPRKVLKAGTDLGWCCCAILSPRLLTWDLSLALSSKIRETEGNKGENAGHWETFIMISIEQGVQRAREWSLECKAFRDLYSDHYSARHSESTRVIIIVHNLESRTKAGLVKSVQFLPSQPCT